MGVIGPHHYIPRLSQEIGGSCLKEALQVVKEVKENSDLDPDIDDHEF